MEVTKNKQRVSYLLSRNWRSWTFAHYLFVHNLLVSLPDSPKVARCIFSNVTLPSPAENLALEEAWLDMAEEGQWDV